MAQPSTTDIIAPFDPTAYANITGAQLLQFLSGATPYTDKGFIVVTADIAGVPQVPDATTTIKWQTYLWIRQSATAISAYIWNPAIGSDTTYQQWVNLNISALAIGSIIGAMIADFTISSDKIISLDASKLTGTLVGSPAVSGFIANNTAAGGDLTGLYPNPSVANVAITTSKIADNSVTHGKLGAKAVEIETDIKPAAVGLSLIRTNTGATALEHFVPNKVTLLANPASAADVGKAVIVASPYTDGFVLSANSFIQTVIKTLITPVSTTVVMPYDNSLPLLAEGTEIATLTFTPKNAGSILRIQFSGVLSNNTDNSIICIALFIDGICVEARPIHEGVPNDPMIGVLDYAYKLTSASAITIKVLMGSGAGAGTITTYFLRNTTINPFHGDGARSYLVVEEFLGTLT